VGVGTVVAGVHAVVVIAERGGGVDDDGGGGWEALTTVVDHSTGCDATLMFNIDHVMC
jgi:hypothetical protein